MTLPSSAYSKVAAGKSDSQLTIRGIIWGLALAVILIV